jgi:hypothetical protein
MNITNITFSSSSLWCVQYRGWNSYLYFSDDDIDTLFPKAFISTYLFRGKTYWSDSTIGCPFYDTQTYGKLKVLPVASNDSWYYGSSSMIQKISFNSSLTNLLMNQTRFLNAYIIQKGSLLGNYDEVKIFAAHSNWNEDNITCDDIVIDYKLEGCRSLSVQINHAPQAWIKINVTELVLCILQQNSTYMIDHLEMNFIWEAIPLSLQSGMIFTESCPDGYDSPIAGFTEWMTSESLEPPILALSYVAV